MKSADSIFRAYDIRGTVNDTLKPAIVAAIGRAFASACQAAQQTTVLVGRDGRLSGPSLETALCEGLCSGGCDVVRIGQVPTPTLYYATYALQTGTGIMVTGSHNPPQYNGLKMMIAGETLAGERIQELKPLLDTAPASTPGTVCDLDIRDRYLAAITADIKPSRKLKIAVDCGNGVAGELAPRLLRALGCEVHELYCEIDGHFPNHHPDPSRPENLSELRNLVVEQQLDVGLAFDGDGDRLGVVDHRGDILWPDRQLILFARALLAHRPGAKIVYDVKCTRHLPAEVSKSGGQPVISKTGHSFIKQKMRKIDAALGGEMSGHIFFADRWYGFDDALYAAARLVEILSLDSRSSGDIFADIPNGVATPEINIAFPEGAHFDFMQTFCARAKFSEPAQICTIDGLRVEFEDGWGLIRASNTTPTLVLRFEADNAAALKRIQALFRSQIHAVKTDLATPF